MIRDRRTHQKKGETKQQIIEFIVSNPSLVVEEPELRQYLKTEHDIREPKNIKKLLKDLSEENCIAKTMEQGFENKWSIENVMQLQRIVEKFNDITKILQKNDKIISMLIDQHFKPYYSKEIFDWLKVFHECDNCLKSPQRPNSIDCNFNEEERNKCIDLKKKNLAHLGNYPTVRMISADATMDKKIDNAVENFRNNFIRYVKISPCFFKICLKTPAEFKTVFEKIFNLNMKNHPELYLKPSEYHKVSSEEYKYNNNVFENCMNSDIVNNYEESLLKYYDNVFEICVHTDIINSEASDEAIEYVHNMKRRP